MGRLRSCPRSHGGLRFPLAIFLTMLMVNWEIRVVIEARRQEIRLGVQPKTSMGALSSLGLEIRATGSVELALASRVLGRCMARAARRRIRTWWAREKHRRLVLEIQLMIGGVELNPGPNSSPGHLRRRQLVSTWTVYNVDQLFQVASVGENTTFASRVSRLLQLLQPESLAAHQLCRLYNEAMERWEAEKARLEATAAAGYDFEREHMDAAATRMKATLMQLSTLRVTRAGDGVTAEQAAVMDKELQTLKDRLEVERLELSAAKCLLAEAKELCPVGKASTDENVWNMLRSEVKARHVRITAETELDRLRLLKKRGKESWTDFILRYQQMAPHIAPTFPTEHTKVLLTRLPSHLASHVVGQDRTTTLDKMVEKLMNVLYWTTSPSSDSRPDPMDLGYAEEEDEENLRRADYKPVISDGRIIYANISGPKTLMIAWKMLIRDKSEYRAESMRHLQKTDRVNFAAEQEGESPTRVFVDPASNLPEAINLFSDDDGREDDDEGPTIARISSMTTRDLEDGQSDISGTWCDSESPNAGVMSIVNCKRISQRETSLHVPVKLNGRNIKALVDTGATHQFVQTKLIHCLGLTDHVRPTTVRVKLADGSVHSLDGEIELQVEIGGTQHILSAYVLPGKGPAFVMGHPTFWENEWLIDIRHKRILRQDHTEVVSGGDFSHEEGKVSNRLEIAKMRTQTKEAVLTSKVAEVADDQVASKDDQNMSKSVGSSVIHRLVMHKEMLIPSYGDIRIEVRSLGVVPPGGSVFVIERASLRQQMGVIARYEPSLDVSRGMIVLSNMRKGAVCILKGTQYATAIWVANDCSQKN